MILFLDDNENRIKEFKNRARQLNYSFLIVKTAFDAIDNLKEIQFDYIFLDHDLGYGTDEYKTGNGMTVVDWIIHNHYTTKQIIIHSWNTPASIEMYKKLKDNFYNVFRIPFGVSFLDNLSIWVK